MHSPEDRIFVVTLMLNCLSLLLNSELTHITGLHIYFNAYYIQATLIFMHKYV